MNANWNIDLGYHSCTYIFVTYVFETKFTWVGCAAPGSEGRSKGKHIWIMTEQMVWMQIQGSINNMHEAHIRGPLGGPFSGPPERATN